MANEDAESPSKAPKPASVQEQPPPSSSATVFSDWASFQAYYSSAGNPIPPGYYHSSVAPGPQGPPYMWGPQHMIAPYGAPPPYVTVYPHGGLYPHPSIHTGSHPYGPYAMPYSNGSAETSVAASGGPDQDGKANENGKASGTSGGGAASQSGESGSEGSSEGSDAQSPDDSNKKRSHESGGTGTLVPVSSGTMAHGAPLVPIVPAAIAGPTTSLNIGMDYWGGPSTITPGRSKLPVKPATSVVAGTLPSSRDGVPSDLWLQDEREIKRQKRKQSNRESARRSRLRKQAECEELAVRVGKLKEENDILKEELQHLQQECEKLTTENISLTERVEKLKADKAGREEVDVEPDPESVAAGKPDGEC